MNHGARFSFILLRDSFSLEKEVGLEIVVYIGNIDARNVLIIIGECHKPYIGNLHIKYQNYPRKYGYDGYFNTKSKINLDSKERKVEWENGLLEYSEQIIGSTWLEVHTSKYNEEERIYYSPRRSGVIDLDDKNGSKDPFSMFLYYTELQGEVKVNVPYNGYGFFRIKPHPFKIVSTE